MLQETCWSACIGSGFRFLQYIVHLVRSYCCGSASHLTFVGHCIQHGTSYACNWSMLVSFSHFQDLNKLFFCTQKSILSSDPGFIMHQSSSLEKHEVEAHSEELELLSCGMPQDFPVEGSSVLVQRARYCRQCKAYVKGFDHHCPAFGNCIGQGNHALFIFLLVGFIISECSYITCSSQFSTKSHILGKAEWETSLSGNLAISTMLFSCLQVVWQVAFLVWHVYCICFNIKTDEWINWRRYPEFQLIVPPQPGQPVPEIRFTNPYNKGILWNLKEFLTAKR
ncbi:unnamed protein product [Ilex paraguariensis]|uniref:S-acyltransferase n=1 Tax=Ilex paraguariensis TaxID=185542 RepID=A0ABC8V4K9_9AQUA